MAESRAWIPIRRSPLSARKPVEARRGAVTISEMAFAGKHILRVDPKAGAAAVKQATGLDLPVTPLTSSVNDEAAILWLGPDEWMLVTPLEDGGATAAKLAEALKGQHHQLVDVGDYYTAVDVHGAKARPLLMKLTTLDIHPRAFAAGQVAGSNFGRVGATLWLVSDIDGDATFRLFVRWSHADYLWCALADAGREWGVPGQHPVAGEKLVI